MADDTGAPHFISYPEGTDPIAAMALYIRNMARDINARLPVEGQRTITVAAGSFGGSRDVVFRYPFATPPRVVVSADNRTWNATKGDVTTDGFNIDVRHLDAATTGADRQVRVDWIAVGQLLPEN